MLSYLSSINQQAVEKSIDCLWLARSVVARVDDIFLAMEVQCLHLQISRLQKFEHPVLQLDL